MVRCPVWTTDAMAGDGGDLRSQQVPLGDASDSTQIEMLGCPTPKTSNFNRSCCGKLHGWQVAPTFCFGRCVSTTWAWSLGRSCLQGQLAWATYAVSKVLRSRAEEELKKRCSAVITLFRIPTLRLMTRSIP